MFIVRSYIFYAVVSSEFIFAYDPETLTSATTPVPNWPESNGNEDVLYTLQITSTGALGSNAVSCHTEDTSLEVEVLILCRGNSQRDLSPVDTVWNITKWEEPGAKLGFKYVGFNGHKLVIN